MDKGQSRATGQPLTLLSLREEDRVIVLVAGEVDHVTSSELKKKLDAAIAGETRTVEVDFCRVTFCDCSGLAVLLEARARAQGRMGFQVIGPLTPVVARLLEVTQTGSSLLEQKRA